MKLSQNTLTLLQNFASIQSNLVIGPGTTIKTLADSKSICAVAEVNESFPREVGIYDLSAFLSAVSLIEDAELDFRDDSVLISNKKNSIVFYYAKTDLLTHPKKDITMPACEVNVDISAAQLKQALSAAKVFGHKCLYIEGKSGVITLTSTDRANKTAHSFSVTLDENNACKATFSFVFDIKNLKILGGDYTAAISSSKISEFKHGSLPLTYYVAVEKTSTYES